MITSAAMRNSYGKVDLGLTCDVFDAEFHGIIHEFGQRFRIPEMVKQSLDRFAMLTAKHLLVRNGTQADVGGEQIADGHVEPLFSGTDGI